MEKHVYFLIPGIRSDGNDLDAWLNEAENWINLNTNDNIKCKAFPYHCNAVDRFVKQRERAEKLVSWILDYKNKGYKHIHLIGHSNGTALIARVLQMNVSVDTVHLISPAAFEDDYRKAFKNNVVRKVNIYGSSADRALKLSFTTEWIFKTINFFSRFIGLPKLGYGSLGLRGPQFALEFPYIVRDFSVNTFDHSTWLDESHLIETLRLILSNDNIKTISLEPEKT